MISLDEKICGYYLDKQQQDIVLDESKHLLVVAGAGSGKTLTILGKINYLIKYKKILPSEILCISFTKASSDSLRDKIKCEFNIDIPVYTFHSLGINILSSNSFNYSIADSQLLESITQEFFHNTILLSKYHMRLLLKYFKINSYRDVKEEYIKFYKNNYNKIILLSNLLCGFIRLFKCNNYQLKDYLKFLNEARCTIYYKKYIQEKIFLIFAINIYLIYQKYLEENNEIDFDDMIIKATECIKAGGNINNFKYIIIDEYQDTSYIRFLLIKSVLDKTGARLMVVGDDFQSIYRFTGCDLSLFINFKGYFQDAKIMKIENTYRNSQELICVAGDFVMKNRKQVRKNLVSSKHIDRPIKIVYYQNIKDMFYKLILSIYKELKTSILILGRNNNDIKLVIDDRFKLLEDGTLKLTNNFNISLKYLTVHKSKGLEEENVIIINLENKLLGFPSQIKDDKVLRFVNKNKEKYMFAEERRLFYVALTRTKNNVYLLTPKKDKSIFVDELIRDYKKNIDIIEI